jgi:hypothetical protein
VLRDRTNVAEVKILVVSEDPLDAITQPEQTLILFPSGNKKVGISMMQVMHYTVGNASWQEKQQQQQKRIFCLTKENFAMAPNSCS